MRTVALFTLFISSLLAIEYPYGTIDPQPQGWPLTEEEEAFASKNPNERGESGWASGRAPVTPSPGYFGTTSQSWLEEHRKLVKKSEANAGPLDVLLIGDGGTVLWDNCWKKNFIEFSSLNLSMQLDMTQNVLWRLDHGGVMGLEPKVIILQVGINNIEHAHLSKPPSIAEGIKLCHANLREKFPKAEIVVVKLFPQKSKFDTKYKYTIEVNQFLDELKLGDLPNTYIFDLTSELLNSDGELHLELYDNFQSRLNQAGNQLFADKLKPLIEKLLNPPETK